jgi:hypothetical protein
MMPLVMSEIAFGWSPAGAKSEWRKKGMSVHTGGSLKIFFNE